MNAITEYRLQLGVETLRCMRVRKLKIASNVLICVLIFVGGYQSGTWSLAIPSMAIVQSVNFPEMIEAYKEAQAKQPPIKAEGNAPREQSE
jgi:hypothetical protein